MTEPTQALTAAPEPWLAVPPRPRPRRSRCPALAAAEGVDSGAHHSHLNRSRRRGGSCFVTGYAVVESSVSAPEPEARSRVSHSHRRHGLARGEANQDQPAPIGRADREPHCFALDARGPSRIAVVRPLPEITLPFRACSCFTNPIPASLCTSSRWHPKCSLVLPWGGPPMLAGVSRSTPRVCCDLLGFLPRTRAGRSSSRFQGDIPEWKLQSSWPCRAPRAAAHQWKCSRRCAAAGGFSGVASVGPSGLLRVGALHGGVVRTSGHAVAGQHVREAIGHLGCPLPRSWERPRSRDDAAGREVTFFRPCCCTVSVCPPAVMVPVRNPFPVVAVTVTDSVALPAPPLDDSEIHVALPLAVQGQDPSDAVSVAANVAPAAATVMLDGDSVNLHAGAITAAACVMAMALPRPSSRRSVPRSPRWR